MWKWMTALGVSIVLVFTWLCVELQVFETIPAGAASSKSASAGAASDSSKENLGEAKKQLDTREQAVRSREEALARKERDLLDKEKFLSQQASRYEKIIQELTGRIGELEHLRADKADNFRTVFEKMESKKASKILEDMDSKTAAGVVASLKRERAGEILSSMSPEKARAITEFVLGKRGVSSAQRGHTQGTEVSTEGEGAPEKGGDK